MATLIVLGVDGQSQAEKALDLAEQLRKEDVLRLDDAAYVIKDDRGRPRIHQTVSTTGAGALSGAFWGTLIGTLFSVPLVGVAVGAASGAISGAVIGRFVDIGVSDHMIKRIGGQLAQGRAAVFLLVEPDTADRVAEHFADLDPTVLHTRLTRDDEQQIVDHLRG